MQAYKEAVLLTEQTEKRFERMIHRWIPLIDGAQERLGTGAHVAEIGCGSGESTIMMARAYPRTFFTGIDPDYKSIITARRNAREAGVTKRVSLLVGSEKSYFGSRYDILITRLDLRDFSDLVETAAYVQEKLLPTGFWLMVTGISGDAEEILREAAMLNGFSGFRLAAQTPANLVFEAKL